jgi:hypothetical protein
VLPWDRAGDRTDGTAAIRDHFQSPSLPVVIRVARGQRLLEVHDNDRHEGVVDSTLKTWQEPEQAREGDHANLILAVRQSHVPAGACILLRSPDEENRT